MEMTASINKWQHNQEICEMNLLKKKDPTRAKQISFSQVEAVAAIAVAAVAADGKILEVESERTLWLLSQLELFKGFSEQKVTKTVDKMFNVLHDKGLNSLVAIANESLQDKHKQTAFIVAADLVFADGVFCGREQVFLKRLREVLDVPVDAAAEILDAKVEENRLLAEVGKRQEAKGKS
jgi:tellurite resistance protein